MKGRKDSKGRNLRDGESQLQDGRYRFRYQDRNGNRQAVYSWRLVATDKTPAGKRDSPPLREKEEAIAADLRDGIDGKAAGKLTLNDYFSVYMDGKRDLKETSVLTYEHVYNWYVRDAIGNMRLSQIRYSDVKRLYNALLDSGLKQNTVRIVQAALHPLFAVAVRDGLIRTNPTDGMTKEIMNAHSGQSPPRHALTIQEQTAFVDFVAASPVFRHWLPLFTFLLGTGCRIGEALGLTWDDCDMKNGTISINHTLSYRPANGGGYAFRVSTPKTAKGCRMIPMLKEVREALNEERRRQMRDGISTFEVDGYRGFIFTSKLGKPRMTEEIHGALKRIYTAYNAQETERARLEGRDPVLIRPFSAHNLRHTFCTRFCENETNVKVIQEIMGHSNVQTTLNIYAEVTESKKQDAFANLEGKIKLC